MLIEPFESPLVNALDKGLSEEAAVEGALLGENGDPLLMEDGTDIELD